MLYSRVLKQMQEKYTAKAALQGAILAQFPPGRSLNAQAPADLRGIAVNTLDAKPKDR